MEYENSMRVDDLSKLESKKLDIKLSIETEKKLSVLIRRVEWKNEELRNDIVSLESWVEKYIPLKL